MKNESFIRRQKQTSNFTILPNDIFKQQMSLKAIGLLCFLLHLPEDWVIVKTELHKRFKDGRDATTGAFNELLKAGYITESEVRKKGKFAGKDFFVHDEIQIQPLTENPLTVKPLTEKPLTDNPTLLNTNTKKELKDKGHSINSNEEFELTGSCPVDGIFSLKPDQQDEQKNPPVAPAPPRSNYVVMMETYYNWFKKRNDNIPPMINGMEGKALKSIVLYLETVARARLIEDGEDTSPENVNFKACESLEFIFAKWETLDAFTQKQVKLTQINSNITNIINHFKNGRKQQTAIQQKGDRVGTIADGFDAIENAFRK